MTKALYAGSFDPFTNGHLDILTQASSCFDEVIVGIAINIDKKGFVPIEQRLKLIKDSVNRLKNVKVVSYTGLTVDFAGENQIDVLIRGIRNSLDFEYEYQMAQINLSLNSDIKTVFFTPEPKNCCISSSVVRELIANNADISHLVPVAVKDFFK